MGWHSRTIPSQWDLRGDPMNRQWMMVGFCGVIGFAAFPLVASALSCGYIAILERAPLTILSITRDGVEVHSSNLRDYDWHIKSSPDSDLNLVVTGDTGGPYTMHFEED
jgi:hypothetical protein